MCFHFQFTKFTMNIPQRDRRKVELFYDWSDACDRLLVDITAFYSQSEIYINIGKAQTKGIEAYIEYSLPGSLTPYTAQTLIRRENKHESFSITDSGLYGRHQI